MRIVVVGPGLMGSQIGCEYALGGHEVVFVARDPTRAHERIEDALALAEEYRLAPRAGIEAARRRIDVREDLAEERGTVELVVESVVEQMEAKVEVLGKAGRTFPDAVLATNTSSLGITELGEQIGAAERTVGTHYWNPPLLMPLVEVIRGESTSHDVAARVAALLRSLGKRPVEVRRDVPGFVWNRLQLALLREAVWLAEQGVASPQTIDEIVRDGLARRWTLTGPFETVALGGAETFERIAVNLLPALSSATTLDGLRPWLDEAPETLSRVRAERDRGLARALRRQRGERDQAEAPE